MEVNGKLRYKHLEADEESKTIHTAEVSKLTKARNEKLEKPDKLNTSSRQTKGRKEGSYTDRPRKTFPFPSLRKTLVDMERAVSNYLGALDLQRFDATGEAYQNSAHSDSQDSSRSEEGLSDYLVGLETRLVGVAGGALYNNAHPGGSAGFAPESQDSSRREEGVIIQLEGLPHRFTYNQLSVATGGFSEESELGHGGFGTVYRGVLPFGLVAVKKMNSATTQSQGMKEFKGEVSIISQLRHRNLVELLGWCEDVARKEYMLVFELMPKGSLDDVLFKPAQWKSGRSVLQPKLSWLQRFHILTGTADALAYLHHGWKKQVIHRDVKCSNLMLDEESNAQLADFGIARLQDHEGEAATTNMAGTLGYIAPEVFTEGRFTEKTDVFAFGVVVLEVACGRRVLPGQSHEMGLVSCVRQTLRKGELLTMVDKRLKDYDTGQMKAVLMIGLACCHSNPRERPSMRHVVQMLGGDSQVELMKMIAHIEEEEASNSRPGLQFDWSPSNSSKK